MSRRSPCLGWNGQLAERSLASSSCSPWLAEQLLVSQRSSSYSAACLTPLADESVGGQGKLMIRSGIRRRMAKLGPK